MSLTRSQYQQIMREYDQLQYQSRHNLEKRKSEIAEKIPQIPVITREITDAGIQAAKERLSHHYNEEQALLKKISLLSKQKEMLLKSLGYPADYLTLKHKCEACGDTGYVNGRACHCLTQRTIDILYRQSNLGTVLMEENFEKFSFAYYSDDESTRDAVTCETPLATIKKVVKESKHFVDTFDETGENLLLYGPTGVGKTFLSHCIAKEALERAKSVLYLPSGQLFELLSEKTFSTRRSDEQLAVHESIFECDLLIIDDLGAEFTNGFTVSSLFHCLNERMLSKKSTIISTNLSLMDLRNVYTERISSRIINNYTLLKISGDDIRRQIRFQQKMSSET